MSKVQNVLRMVVNNRSLSVRNLSSYSRTTIDSTSFKLANVKHFKPKSLVILSTPNFLSDVIEQSIALHSLHGLQVITAGVDTVVPNSSRSGVSELWLDSHIDINSATSLEASRVGYDENNSHEIQESQVDKNNWEKSKSMLEVCLKSGSNVNLKLANTLFTQGRLTTMYYLQPEIMKDELTGELLNNLSITLPDKFENLHVQELQDNWIPLYDEDAQSLKISSCKGNLVKTVNGKSAAKFLEDNDKLMSVVSKDTEVYVKVKRTVNDVPKRYKVIAGGGGWGSKANIIALSPEANLNNGDLIQFYMLSPSEKFTQKNVDPSTNTSQRFMFECSYEEQNYNQNSNGDGQIYENLFGAGCENGFTFNGVQHVSAGERLTMSL